MRDITSSQWLAAREASARDVGYAEGYEAGRAEVTAAVEALADELALDTCHRCRHEDCLAQRECARKLRAALAAAAPTLATVRADAGRDEGEG